MKRPSTFNPFSSPDVDALLDLLRSLIHLAFALGAGISLIGWHIDDDAWVNGGMVIMTGAFIAGMIAAGVLFFIAFVISMKNRRQIRQDT